MTAMCTDPDCNFVISGDASKTIHRAGPTEKRTSSASSVDTRLRFRVGSVKTCCCREQEICEFPWIELVED